MADLAVESIPGGRRFSVEQGKWTAARAALVPLAIAIILGVASFWVFSNGNWVLGIAIGLVAVLAWGVTILLGGLLLAFSLSLKPRVQFSVTSDGIRTEDKTISVAEIVSIHQGVPRSSSGVEIGFAGDIAALMAFAFAHRNAAVWVRVGDRAIYLARQIRTAEAAEIFNEIKGIIRLS